MCKGMALVLGLLGLFLAVSTSVEAKRFMRVYY